MVARDVVNRDMENLDANAEPPPATYRAEVIEEFYAAAVEGRPPLHDGEWGLATMQVCIAMLRSAREQREIYLDDDQAR